MTIRRSRMMEAWLSELVRSFQDGRVRTRNLEYSNLTQLGRPTQIYCIAARQDEGWVASLVVSHATDVANGTVRAVTVSGDIGELAALADDIDRLLGMPNLGQQDLGDRFVTRQITAGQHGLIALASRLRQPIGNIEPGFRVGRMSAIGAGLRASLWLAEYRKPLPSRREVLVRMGSQPVQRARPEVARPHEPGAEQVERVPVGYAAQSYPPLWFGEPPFQSIHDVIRASPRWYEREERLLQHRPVAQVETYVYNSGLVLAETPDRVLAQFTINQVFGALTRSGLVSLAVREAELLTVTGFDPNSGNIGASQGMVTERNWLRGPPIDGLARSVLLLPESVITELVVVADQCAQNQNYSKEAARLLSARTLLEQGSYTEAFVMGWSLIETSLERDFRAFWQGQGRSKSAIRDMDWTAAQQIDLLQAVGEINSADARRIHELRRKRNGIVHDLRDADRQETEHCIRIAAGLSPLPQLSQVLVPRIALV